MANVFKNNKWTIFGLCMIVLFAVTGNAHAVDYNIGAGLETTAIKKTSAIFASARNIMFVIGGFGLIAVSFAAILGKMPWKWVGSLAIGLGTIAAATAVIEYAIDADLKKGGNTTWEDTLK